MLTPSGKIRKALASDNIKCYLSVLNMCRKEICLQSIEGSKRDKKLYCCRVDEIAEGLFRQILTVNSSSRQT